MTILDQTTESQVLLDDDIIHSSHDESDLSGIRCAGEMCVDLLCFVLVQADKTVQDIITGRGIIISTFVVWEVVLHWADGKLLLESVNLVEEENDGCLDEPS